MWEDIFLLPSGTVAWKLSHYNLLSIIYCTALRFVYFWHISYNWSINKPIETQHNIMVGYLELKSYFLSLLELYYILHYIQLLFIENKFG